MSSGVLHKLAALIGRCSLFGVYIVLIWVHFWTILFASKNMGVIAAFLTFIVPVGAQLFWSGYSLLNGSLRGEFFMSMLGFLAMLVVSGAMAALFLWIAAKTKVPEKSQWRN